MRYIISRFYALHTLVWLAKLACVCLSVSALVRCHMDLSAPSLSLPMDIGLWWGEVGAADTTAQFKEMEQEMWAESEQSSLSVYLS